MGDTDSESCSVMQWGINLTGLRMLLVHKSPSTSRSGLAMGDLGRLRGRQTKLDNLRKIIICYFYTERYKMCVVLKFYYILCHPLLIFDTFSFITVCLTRKFCLFFRMPGFEIRWLIYCVGCTIVNSNWQKTYSPSIKYGTICTSSSVQFVTILKENTAPNNAQCLNI
jgi:hypothetical protein